jgi:hypothetical protein
MVGMMVAGVLAVATPTPFGLATGALILLGVAVAVSITRCPQCRRRLGPIIGFDYCTSCGCRIA